MSDQINTKKAKEILRHMDKAIEYAEEGKEYKSNPGRKINRKLKGRGMTR